MATIEQNATSSLSATKDKEDEELARRVKRSKLKILNLEHAGEGMACSSWALPDSVVV
jgi:hypothetical protein